MNIEDIKLLNYNSFFSSHLIAHFLGGCKDQTIKYEIIFLLLPFVYHSETRQILISSKSNSNIYSAFLDNYEGKVSLGGLEKRYDYFKELTKTSLIVAANNYEIVVSDFISIANPPNYEKEKDNSIKQFYRASYYLGSIFSKSDYLDIFIKLGLKKI